MTRKYRKIEQLKIVVSDVEYYKSKRPDIEFIFCNQMKIE